MNDDKKKYPTRGEIEAQRREALPDGYTWRISVGSRWRGTREAHIHGREGKALFGRGVPLADENGNPRPAIDIARELDEKIHEVNEGQARKAQERAVRTAVAEKRQRERDRIVAAGRSMSEKFIAEHPHMLAKLSVRDDGTLFVDAEGVQIDVIPDPNNGTWTWRVEHSETAVTDARLAQVIAILFRLGRSTA